MDSGKPAGSHLPDAICEEAFYFGVDMEYLKIRNWDKWQSYRNDRGQPPWIKVHRCLMRDPEWVSLTDSERGQLVSIWMLAADKEGIIPANPDLIRKLCFLDKKPNINKFKELKFIESESIHNDVNLTSSCGQSDFPEKNRLEADKNRVEAEADKIIEFSESLELPKIKGKSSRDKLIGRINERLSDGYTAEDLMDHLSRFEAKKKMHLEYQDQFGVEPDIGCPAWCPRTTWRIYDIFSPERLDKYFSVWEIEGELDQAATISKCRDMQLKKNGGTNGTNQQGNKTDKYCRSDDRPWSDGKVYGPDDGK